MTPLKNTRRFATMGFLLFAGFACTKTAFLTSPPVITGITPKISAYGLRVPVTIYGSNFSPSQNSDLVAFKGLAAVVQTASMDSLVVVVPDAAETGPVTVTVNGQTAIGPIFIHLANVFQIGSPTKFILSGTGK